MFGRWYPSVVAELILNTVLGRMVFKHCVGLDGVEVRCVCVVQALLLLQRLQEDEEEERGQAITQVGQGDGRRKFAHVEEQMKGCGDGAVVEGEGEVSTAKLKLLSPVCTRVGEKIALSRRVDKHWRLIGWGQVLDGVVIDLE